MKIKLEAFKSMVNIDFGNGIVFLGAGVTFAVSGLLAIIAMFLVIFFIDQFELKTTIKSESSIVA